MDLSKMTDKDLNTRIDSIKKNADWEYVSEWLYRKLKTKYDSLKTNIEPPLIYRCQGYVYAIEWILQNDK